MGLREDILTVLRCSAALRMSFSFTTVTAATITVNGSTFERVARAIENGQITIVPSTSSDHDEAQYDAYAEGNPLTVPPIRHRRMQEAIVLHEAVHASFDLTRSAIPRIDNEVAAFIAGTIYLRRTGFPRSRYAGTFEEAALAATNAIIGGSAPTSSQLQTIRRALEDDPEYRRDIHWGCTVGTPCYLIDRGNG
jgi:hypothetical protein